MLCPDCVEVVRTGKGRRCPKHPLNPRPPRDYEVVSREKVVAVNLPGLGEVHTKVHYVEPKPPIGLPKRGYVAPLAWKWRRALRVDPEVRVTKTNPRGGQRPFKVEEFRPRGLNSILKYPKGFIEGNGTGYGDKFPRRTYLPCPTCLSTDGLHKNPKCSPTRSE